ncbi:MAG: hypothetical protein JEZ06_01515 [Anaerolineaceae bacterium]|nr:hypothetical protein [Anaerolineaceae bacterium]
MSDKKYNPSIVEEGIGGLTILSCILFSPVLRPWYRKWGATEEEIQKPLPGDDQVVQPNLETTRAISIQSPIEKVWPWLVQIGQGRGGLYSYERLENLVGCDMHNADRIIPEYQELTVGDKIRLTPEGKGPFFTVEAVIPGKALILGGDIPPTSWSFILEPIDEKSTRLLIRFRQQYEPTFFNTLMWRVLTDPISFVMERMLLKGIQLRAENSLSI